MIKLVTWSHLICLMFVMAETTQGQGRADSHALEVLRGVENSRKELSSFKFKMSLTNRGGDTSEFVVEALRDERLFRSAITERQMFDGQTVYHFDGKKSCSLYSIEGAMQHGFLIFDPRTIGITASHSAIETVKSSLGLESPQSVQFVGPEQVGTTNVEHVQVVDRFGRQLDFWVEPKSFRVYRCKERNPFRQYVTISEFGPRAAVGWLPTKLTTTELDLQGQELGVNSLSVSSAEEVIANANFKLSRLELPAGTVISDIRIHERLGYWDGSKISELFR